MPTKKVAATINISLGPIQCSVETVGGDMKVAARFAAGPILSKTGGSVLSRKQWLKLSDAVHLASEKFLTTLEHSLLENGSMNSVIN